VYITSRANKRLHLPGSRRFCGVCQTVRCRRALSARQRATDLSGGLADRAPAGRTAHRKSIHDDQPCWGRRQSLLLTALAVRRRHQAGRPAAFP